MGDGGGRERDALTHLPAYVPVPRSDLRHRGTAVLAVAGCVALWVSRRPEQLSRPYVWAEESLVLSDYLHNGWSAALQPVNGSLNLPHRSSSRRARRPA